MNGSFGGPFFTKKIAFIKKSLSVAGRAAFFYRAALFDELNAFSIKNRAAIQ